jgi:hypothetical protein
MKIKLGHLLGVIIIGYWLGINESMKQGGRFSCFFFYGVNRGRFRFNFFCLITKLKHAKIPYIHLGYLYLVQLGCCIIITMVKYHGNNSGWEYEVLC